MTTFADEPGIGVLAILRHIDLHTHGQRQARRAGCGRGRHERVVWGERLICQRCSDVLRGEMR